MVKFLTYFTLLTSAVHAGLLRRRNSCPQQCGSSGCPLPPQVCYYGLVKDACSCCEVCGAGEGEVCGDHAKPCGDGLRCDRVPGSLGALRGLCVCVSSGSVCGSDGRTYPSICRLKAENRRAELLDIPEVILMRRGRCDSGINHPESIRYKFNFIADVVDRIVPAVVHLELFQSVPFSTEEVSASSASGFIVSEDGWIITNAHVLTNKQRVKVELKSGVHFDALVQDIDQKMDIALIKIETDTPLPVLHLGQSSDLRPGEFVVAVGSPFSLQSTITTGVVSTAQRTGVELGLKDTDVDYIQTDAMINYGNSGGPLVNLDGDVVGINTLKVAAGISFAIPADRIFQFLAESHNRRVKGKTPQKKKFIGAGMLELSAHLIQVLKEHVPEFPDVSSGVYVYEVLSGSAASSAGINNHDVIISVNEQPVRTMKDVSDAIQREAVLSLVVRRYDGDVTLTVFPEETG